MARSHLSLTFLGQTEEIDVYIHETTRPEQRKQIVRLEEIYGFKNEEVIFEKDTI